MEVTERLDSFSIKDDAELPSFLPAQLEQAEQQLMPPMHTDQVETAARRNTPTQLPTVEGNTTITSPHNQQLDDLDSGDCRTTYIDNGTQLDEDFTANVECPRRDRRQPTRFAYFNLGRPYYNIPAVNVVQAQVFPVRPMTPFPVRVMFPIAPGWAPNFQNHNRPVGGHFVPYLPHGIRPGPFMC